MSVMITNKRLEEIVSRMPEFPGTPSDVERFHIAKDLLACRKWISKLAEKSAYWETEKVQPPKQDLSPEQLKWAKGLADSLLGGK